MESERISPFWVGGYHPFSAMMLASVIFDMMTTGLGPANQAVGHHIGKYMFLVYTPKVLTLLVAFIAMRGFNSLYGLVIGYIALEIISALIRVFVSKKTCGIDINPSLIPDNYFQQFLGVFVGLTICFSATASWKIEL